MMEFRAITKSGEKVVSIGKSELVSVVLPQIWNEAEVAERMGDTEYYIERDWTEQTSPGVFTYHNAMLYTKKALSQDVTATLLSAYEQTQDEYVEKKAIEKAQTQEQLFQRIETLEALVAQLEIEVSEFREQKTIEAKK